MLKPAVPDRVADPISAVSSFNVPNLLTTVRIVVVPILAWLLFKEKLSLINWVGIVLSLVAIALIAFG